MTKNEDNTFLNNYTGKNISNLCAVIKRLQFQIAHGSVVIANTRF